MNKLSQIQGLHHVTSLAAGAEREQRVLHEDPRSPKGEEDSEFRRAVACITSITATRSALPGAVMTYFPFPHIARGRPGSVRSAKRCSPCRKARCRSGSSAWSGPASRASKPSEIFGEKRLHFAGPDGDGFALVERRTDARPAWTQGGVDGVECDPRLPFGIAAAARRRRDRRIAEVHGLRGGRYGGRRQAARDPERERRRLHRYRDDAEHRVPRGRARGRCITSRSPCRTAPTSSRCGRR